MRYDGMKSKPKPRVASFETLMARIDVATFIRMAMKSGLPPMDQRALIDAFRTMK